MKNQINFTFSSILLLSQRDYDEYGIQIRVKYRNAEKLQALDRHVQSGGERAVAIAIYTLSLQHITHVPFRCVDEINQGMDPRNERKVFEMLVDETCRPGQSQYFFVTPKVGTSEVELEVEFKNFLFCCSSFPTSSTTT